MKWCRVVFKSRILCANKSRQLKDWVMEEDDGFGFWIWGMAEVVNIAIGTEAADDLGTRRGINGMALRADGDFAVVANPDMGLLAPDERPPRAGWNRA